MVALEDDLGVAAGFKRIAQLLQFASKLEVVIDLTVEDHRQLLKAVGLVGVFAQVHNLQVIMA